MTDPFTSIVGDGPERLAAFIVERETVRQLKERGSPWPWTSDGILQTFRFCNVHREDDAVTRWIARNWREPYSGCRDLWHLMCLARLLNEPASLCDYEERNNIFPLWSEKAFRAMARSRKQCKVRMFNPAYMITTAGKKLDKVEYIVQLLRTLHSRREKLRPQLGDTLNSWHMLLSGFDGLGSFLAGQVVADMRYVEPLRSASDWQTFAASGPGSRRGLNRALGRSVSSPWNESDWRQAHYKLQTRMAVLLHRSRIELHGQDLQNCLCEFDKYCRVLHGEGRPKQRYRRTS